MPIDPVQSIRVATNLAERFGALLAESKMTVSELELRIGEAQQLYPEIWRHLDEARTALVERGRDVSEFDHMRRDELAQLGVTDIESYTTVDYAALIGGALRTKQVKTATFNVAGYRRALEACNALMRVMPEVDWKALAQAEEKEIRAAGSLQTAKWKGGAKLIVIAAVLLGVAIIIHRVMMDIEEDPPAPKSATQRKRETIDKQREQQRFTRIVELKEVYAVTCDRAVKMQLVSMLRDADQVTEANQLDSSPCTPQRPSCDRVKDAIAARLQTDFHLIEDKSWAMTCQGILMSRGAGLEPGLAVVLAAKDTDGHVQTLRGVASLDGARDLVTFGTAPGTRLAGVGDLDHDNGEELVFVDSSSLTVTRIEGPGFVDVEGPELPKGCAADANVEGDFRNGRKGEYKRLVLTVPDGVGAKCLAPGRHYYELRRDGLAEVP